jgi:hypothetical protein
VIVIGCVTFSGYVGKERHGGVTRLCDPEVYFVRDLSRQCCANLNKVETMYNPPPSNVSTTSKHIYYQESLQDCSLFQASFRSSLILFAVCASSLLGGGLAMAFRLTVGRPMTDIS